MSQDLTEVVVVVPIGVATEVVIVVVGVVTSRTVPAEGGAAEDSKLQLIKVLTCARRTLLPRLLCIYAIPCTCHRIQL